MIANKETTRGLVHLTTEAQLDEIDQLSRNGKVYIIKHSTRCGISHAAMEQVDSFVAKKTHLTFYYLDLIAYRSVSNQVADRYRIPHSSPQVLVIVNGQSVRHATHYAIDERWLQKAMY